MSLTSRECELSGVEGLREQYRAEMDCQVIHDSIHRRPGWTKEFAIETGGGGVIGYGSVAVAGPWREKPTLYEFFVGREHRGRVFAAFASLRELCGAKTIETQSNDPYLAPLLLAFCRNIETGAILFEDLGWTALEPEGAGFREAEESDAARLEELDLDTGAQWVVTLNGELAGAGGVLYHYNRPYGDVYMKIGEPFRRRGLGAYLVQELKRVCRAGGSVPAARCNVVNVASRMTLQRAGFGPCGVMMAGDWVG